MEAIIGIADIILVGAFIYLFINITVKRGVLNRLLKVVLIPLGCFGYLYLLTDYYTGNMAVGLIIALGPVGLFLLLLLLAYITGAFEKQNNSNYR
jgi:hypothetical protein